MTICIAAVCMWKGKKCLVLCADYQGTRGAYVKAEDTYKLWHFHAGKGAIGFAGNADAGKEFMRRFTAVSRQFEAIKKTHGEGDMDLRVGQYLAAVRELSRSFIKERIEHHLATRFCVTLSDFRGPDAARRFPPREYDEISLAVKGIDLGAEFLVAYVGDEEPLLFRILQNGETWIEDTHYLAIGSGEALALGVLSQIEGDETLELPACLTWVYQAKLTAERNPYVGGTTTFWVLLPDRDDLLVSSSPL